MDRRSHVPSFRWRRFKPPGLYARNACSVPMVVENDPRTQARCRSLRDRPPPFGRTPIVDAHQADQLTGTRPTRSTMARARATAHVIILGVATTLAKVMASKAAPDRTARPSRRPDWLNRSRQA